MGAVTRYRVVRLADFNIYRVQRWGHRWWQREDRWLMMKFARTNREGDLYFVREFYLQDDACKEVAYLEAEDRKRLEIQKSHWKPVSCAKGE